MNYIFARTINIIKKLNYLSYDGEYNCEEERKEQVIIRYMGYMALFIIVILASGHYLTVYEVDISFEVYFFLVFTFSITIILMHFRFYLYYPLSIIGDIVIELLQAFAFIFVFFHSIILLASWNMKESLIIYSQNNIISIIFIIIAIFILSLIRIYRRQIIEYLINIEKNPQALLNELRFAIVEST